MNAPVLLAQLAGSSAQTPASPKNLKIEKPQNGQAVTVHLDGASRLDLGDIASEKLTFVRVGEKLVILFDNQSTVTIDPVFDNNGRPVTDLAFDMGADRTLSSEQFAQAFPITTDQSVLPAAGGATGPTGGANFADASVSALAGSGARLGLLVGEDGAGTFAADTETQANATPNPNGVASVVLNEDGFAEGNLGGSGDTGGAATSVTGSLNVNFGTDSVGRSFAFNADQPGLQGLTSGGQSVQLAIANIGGVPTLIGYVGADSSVAANQVFTITLNVTETGDTYTFNLLRPLDHSQPGTIEETLNLTISVTAIDGSSDTAPVTIQIGINDDTPTIGAPAGATVVDPLDGASSAQSGSLGISWGADRFNNSVDGGISGSTGGNGDRSVIFASSVVNVSGTSTGDAFTVGALTSNGETVRYVLLANGTTLVAYTGETVPTLPGTEVGNNIVFVVTLSDASNAGSYTITQYQPLDHVSGGQNFSSIGLSFQFRATDSDGDSFDGTFTIQVTDTLPTIGEAVAARNLGEDGLPGANQEGGSYDAADNATLSNIALNINWGADNDTRGNGGSDVYGRTLSFLSGGETQNPLGAGNVSSLALAITGENGAVLTSGGVALQYVVTVNVNGGETLTAYRGAPGESNVVFTVTLDPTAPNGAYSFTLIGQLDHAVNSNSIGLTFTVQAADADGDTVNTSFTVNVQDDTPIAHEVTAATTLDDEAQAVFAGNAGGTGDVANANVAQGAAGTLFTSGADGVKSVTISGGAFEVVYKDANGFAQTESVTWGAGVKDASGNTTFTATSAHYTGSDGSSAAATLLINVDGSYTYTAYAPVVQSTAGKTEENQTIKINVTVTDGDGDTASGSLSVNVNDDTPVAHTITASRALDDEAQGVFTPTNSGGIGDVSPNVNSVSGAAGSLFTAGADGVNSVALAGPAFNVIFKDAQGFAQIEGISWSAGVKDASGNTIFTATSAHYTGSNGSSAAATLVIGADGSYKLTLSAPVAHDLQLPAVEENKTLTFSVTVTDGDGDQATATLRVDVNDDTPVPVASIVFGSQVMDDEAQALFTPVNNGGIGDVSPNVGSVSGGAGTLFNMGADGLGSLSVGLPSFNAIYKADGFARVESVDWSNGVRSADGVTTFTATGHETGDTVAVLVIKADGSYSFTLSKPVAHDLPLSGIEEPKTLTFTYLVTDGDGDAAVGSLSVSVNDDTPIAKVVTASTVLDDEAQSIFTPVNAGGTDDVADTNTVSGGAGTLFSAGADGVRAVTISGGVFDVVYKDGGFAKTETITWGAGVKGNDGSTTFTASSSHYTNAATLVIGADGSYTFTVFAPVVQPTAGAAEENKTIKINFTVTDGDGDTASGSLSVNVNDDTPVAHNITSATILDDEAQTVFAGNAGGAGDVANANVAQGTAGALFTAGADGVKSVTISGGAFQVVYKDANGFAQIESVTWGAGVKDASGNTTFTATSAHYTGTGSSVAATLVIGADGSYTYTAFAPVVQSTASSGANPTEENATIKVDFVVTDGDGDTAAGSLSVDVNDDTPVAKAVTATTILDDEAQTVFAGNAGGTGDVANANVAQGSAGTLFTAGADGVKSVTISGGAFQVVYKDANGFAQIERVTGGAGVKDASGNTTFTATSAHYTGTGSSVAATLVIGVDGSYTYTAFAPVVQSTVTSGASPTEENTTIKVDFVVTDGDGDTAAGSLSIDVNDDTPVAKAVTATTVLDDEAQTVFAGNAGGTGDVANANVAQGNAGALFTAGADGVKSVTISGGSFEVVYKDGGFAKTESVTWGPGVTDANGNTTFTATSAHYTGTGGSSAAATLVIGADGSYVYTSYAPVVQPTAGTTEENRTIKIDFTVTDGDGDTASGSLSVDVNDDAPAANVVTATTVLDDEAQSVFAPNAGGVSGDVTPDTNTVSGSAGSLFTAGADGVRSVAMTSAAFDVIYKDANGFAQTETATWGSPVVGVNGATTWTATSAHYASGAAVLVINADGSYSFTVNAPIVHSTNSTTEENKPLTFTVTVTDGDGDTATGSLTVNVNDDTIVLGTAVAGLVDEGNLIGGNKDDGYPGDLTAAQGDNGTRSTSGSLAIAFGADGKAATVMGGTQTQTFTFSGNSTLTPDLVVTNGTVNHGSAPGIVFGGIGNPIVVNANDSLPFKLGALDLGLSGAATTPTVILKGYDSSNNLIATYTLSVANVASLVSGTPTHFDATGTPFANLLIDRLEIYTGIGFNGYVMADNLVVTQNTASGPVVLDAAVTFTDHSNGQANLIIKDANGNDVTASLTSNGQAVHYAMIDAVTLIGYTGATAPASLSDPRVVFSAVLSSASANGSYTFTQNAPLDHPIAGQDDDLTFTFNFTAKDGDGDKANGHFTVTVDDDAPTATAAVLSGAVYESELSTATGDLSTGTQAGNTDNKNGDAGTDDSILTGNLSSLVSMGADSAGRFVVETTGLSASLTSLTSGGVALTYTVVGNTLIAWAGTNQIFTFAVDATTGAYTFTLKGQIDHVVTGGTDALALDLSSAVTVRDGDGDTVALHDQLIVTVTDDVPVITGSAASATVDETNEPLVQVAYGSLKVSIGADKVGAHLDFATDGNGQPLHPAGLKSDGVDLDFVLRTTQYGEKQLVAFKQGDTVDNPVFIVALSSPTNPTYIFTLYQNLDHAPNSNTLGLDFTVRVTDGDGDHVDQAIHVNVTDSVPTIPATTVQRADVQDDALVNGNPETGDTATASGTLSFNFGADGNGHLSWVSATVPGGGFTSIVNGNVFEIYQLQNSVNVKVFTVTLNPATGEYLVEQFAAVHHPDGGGELGETFNLIYRVTDGDGDYVDGSLSVVVGDDVPVIVGNATQVNLLTNGDFSGGTFAHTESWGQWATDSTGWKITGTQPGQTGVQLERVESGYLGIVTSNGHPMVDLAATPGNIAISQAINGLPPGQHYTLSFEIGASIPSSAGLEVYWNGQLVGTYQPGSTMTIQTIDVIAQTDPNNAHPANIVTFKEVGSVDNAGTYLANVSLVQASSTSLPVFHADIGEDGTSVVSLVSGTNFRFGADGPGSVAFDTAHATISTPNGTTLGVPSITYDPLTGKVTVNPGWGFNGLSEGEIATLSVPFTVTDSDGDTKTGIYQFTIHGTNDAVTTSDGFPDAGTMTEYAETDPRAASSTDRVTFDAPPGYGGLNGGGFWIYDDQGDTHTLTVTPQGANYLGHVTAVVSEETVNDGAGFVNWQYHVTDAELNPLAAGQTKIEKFTISVDDGHGSTTSRVITVTLVGTNDTPEIIATSSNVVTGTIIEDATPAPAPIDLAFDGGFNSFVNGVPVGWQLTKGAPGSSTGGGFVNGSNVVTFYSMSTTPDTLSQTVATTEGRLYEVRFQLGNAYAWGANGLTVTWNGQTYLALADIAATNDPNALTWYSFKAVATSGASELSFSAYGVNGSLQLDNVSVVPVASESATGVIHFTDIDTIDTHTVSVTPTASGYLGTLLATVSDDSTNDGSGAVSWVFNVEESAIQFLAAGQTLQQIYTISISDGHGGVVTQNVTVTLTGTNDAPVIDLSGPATAGNDVSVGAVEQMAQWIFNSATITDVDSSTMHSMTVTLTSQPDGLGLEGLSLNTSATNALTAAGLTYSYNATTGVLTVSGDASTATYQTILRGVVYQYTGDAPSTGDRTVTVVVNDGLDNSVSHTGTVHIIPMNDAPVLGGTLSATVTEGGSHVLTASELGYTDPDNISSEVVFRVSNVQHGVITNGGAPATSFTAAELAAGLIKFTHDGSEDPTTTFQVAVEDGNQDGSTPVPGTFTFTVQGVNDAPVNALPAGPLTVNEDTPLSITGLSISDVDAGSSAMTTTLSVTSGTITVLGGSGVTVTNNGTGSVTLSGSQADINAALAQNNGVVYQDALNHNGGVDLTVTTSDLGHSGAGGTLTDTDTIHIDVTPVNDAAIITGNTSGTATEAMIFTAGTSASGDLNSTDVDDPADAWTVVATATATASGYGKYTIDATGHWTYTVNNANTVVDGLKAGEHLSDTFTVTTVDGTPQIVTVTITGVNDYPVANDDGQYVVGEDVVTVFQASQLLANDTDAEHDTLTVDYVGTTASGATVTLNANGTISYDPTGVTILQQLAADQTMTDEFTYRVNDGHGGISTATVKILVQGANDAPVVAVVTGTATEGGPALALDALANASDIDNGAILSVTGIPANLPAGVTYNASTHKFTLDPTNAAYDYLAAGQTTTVTVSYGVTDGIATTPGSVSWTLTGTNDAPVLSDMGNTAAYTENGAAVAIDSTITLSDVDDTHIEGATVKITGNYAAGQDVLSFINQNGITGSWNAATGTLTLSGSATKAQYEAALESVTYKNTSEDPSTAARTISFTVTDGDLTSNVGTATVNVTAVNDAPVIVGHTSGAGAGEDAAMYPPVKYVGSMAVSDPDGGPPIGQLVGTAISVSSGSLTVAQQDAITAALITGKFAFTNVTTDSNGYKLVNWELTAPGAINLDFLAAGQNLTVTFNMAVSDGMATSNTVSYNIVFTGTNDAPVLTGDRAATVAEGGTYTIIAADLGFSDPDDVASGVTFTASSLSHGLLQVNGVTATTFTGTQLAAGQVTFVHDSSEGNSAGFQISVEDGNEDNSTPVSQPFTFTVTPVNDGAASITVTDTTQTATAPKTGDVLQANLGADPDGTQSNVVYHWQSDGVNIAGATGATYTLVAGDAGHKISVNVTYTDGQGFSENVTSAQTVTVISSNHAPVAVNDTLNFGGSVGTAPTGAGWVYNSQNGHYYKFVAGSISFDQAVAGAAAQTQGAYLLTVTSAAEQSFVLGSFSSLTTGQLIWLGASDSASEGTFVWVTGPEAGTVVSGYTPWGPGEPNNWDGDEDYVSINRFSGSNYNTPLWNDSGTSLGGDSNGYIVEWGGIGSGPGVSEDVVTTFNKSMLLANDTDADGDTLNITSVSASSAKGAVVTYNSTTGQISYDPTNAATIQALAAGATTTDTFTYTINDGHGGTSTATATITINGVNDAAIITGAKTGAVTEAVTGGSAGTPTATGDLNSTDIDGTADAWTVVSTATATANGYGSYTINAAGQWSYVLNNSNTTVNALNNGQTLTDTFTVSTTDGTTQVVTITINGATDPALQATATAYNYGQGSNNSATNAYDITGLNYVKSNDPDVTNASTSPSITISARTTSNEYDYYKFVIAQSGTTVTFDIDNTSSGFDTWIRIRNSTNTSTIADNDQSTVVDSGSISVNDSYLSTTLNAGTYYLQVGRYNNSTGQFTTFSNSSATYELQVSIVKPGGDPIVFDLGNDGIAFSSLHDGVQFDVNSDGIADRTAWITGNDGILAVDLDGSGKIESGKEVFAPNFNGGNFADGLAALATFDSNHDGKIDVADVDFGKLVIWQDANHNGITDPGELKTLTEWGITSIALAAAPADGTHGGQQLLAQGTYTYADGSTGHFIEVDLEKTIGATPTPIIAYDEAAAVADADFSGSAGVERLQLGDFANTVTLGAAAEAAAAHGTLTIDGTAAMSSSHTLSVDGSAVSTATHLDIFGGAGNDVLIGGHGDDILAGGRGNDTLTGGAGADRFTFAEMGHDNMDTILDYDAGQSDVIDISALLGSLTGAAADGSNIERYVHLEQNNNNIVVQVDAAGTGNFSGGSHDVAVLQGYGTSNADIVRIAFQGHEHQMSA